MEAHMAKRPVSLFFPLHNERDNIRPLVSGAMRVLGPTVRTFEILLIDDGSTDGTGAIADELAAADPRIRVIHHGKSRGYGGALRTGFSAAKYETIVFADADLQFDMHEIIRFLDLDGEYQCVIGYRAPRADNFQRKLNGAAWTFLVRILFGLKVKDLNCGFKMFHRSVMDRVRFVSVGAAATAEILVQISRMGIPIKELPVRHFPRKSGSQSGARCRVILTAFCELIRFKISHKKAQNPQITG